METLLHAASFYAAGRVRPRVVQLHSLIDGAVADLRASEDYLARLAVPIFEMSAVAHVRKMWRLRAWLNFLWAMPFVRAIVVCNSLALRTTHEDSDIDLLILTEPQRVWTARWFVTGLLAVMRLRRGEAWRDPLCASFFAATDLAPDDWNNLRLRDDLYFHFWQKSAGAVRGDLPWRGNELPAEWTQAGRWPLVVRRVLEKVFALAPESWWRRQQEKIMPAEILVASQKNNTEVVLSWRVIKIHANDRRAEWRERAAAWSANCV